MLAEIAVWLLTSTLMIVGLAGVLVPLLPGTTLIAVAGCLQAWLLPDSLGAVSLSILGVLWVLSLVLEVVATMLGSRWCGAGRWGMAGATGGGLLGLLWGPVRGVILGSILGAALGEWFAGRRETRDVVRAGLGAGAGFVLGTMAKGVCALAMVGLIVGASLS